MEPLLQRFHRQYLQQVTNLTYPQSQLLAHSDIQKQLYRYFFDKDSDQFLPPPEYQRKVLKKIVDDIISEAKDEDDEVSDELMAHMGHLSSLSKTSEAEAVRQPRVLSYFSPTETPFEETRSPFEATSNGGYEHFQNDQRILIKESPQLLAAGSNVGLRTWPDCLRLAYYLCTSNGRSSFKGANVLELGAGAGLLSLICSMWLGAKNVVATDGLAHVVESIEANVALNKENNQLSSTPHARVLDWTDLSDLDDVLGVNGKKVVFDYILAADIIYYHGLLDSIALLLSKLKDEYPACRILIGATIRNEHTMQLWEQTCQKHSLTIQYIEKSEEQWKCPPYRLQTGLFHEHVFPMVIMNITK